MCLCSHGVDFVKQACSLPNLPVSTQVHYTALPVVSYFVSGCFENEKNNHIPRVPLV